MNKLNRIMKLRFILYLLLGAFLIPSFAQAQLISITGKIVDNKSGQFLENANIFESVSNIGTISNENGYFKLQLKKGELNLNVTNNGFKDFSQNLILRKDTMLTVRLEPQLTKKSKSKRNSNLQASVSPVK